MAIVVSCGPAGFAGMGATVWTHDQAVALKEVLDAVTTNEEAIAVGTKAYNELSGLLAGLGGLSTAGMFHDYFDADLSTLGAALTRLPWSGPVDDSWSGQPDGARRAIERATLTAATLTAEAPPGSLDLMDAKNFWAGFTSTLRGELEGITSAARELVGGALEAVGKGLQIPSWVWWAAGGLAVAYGVSQLKAVKELIS